MNSSVNDSRSAARALSARNAVTFDCVHSLDECRGRLSATSVPTRQALFSRRRSFMEEYRRKMTPQPPVLFGFVTGDRVDLSWEFARFKGQWVQDASGLHLAGHVERSVRVPLVLGVAAVPLLFATAIALKTASASHWQAPGLYWFFIPAAVVVVGMPLLVMGLGSMRVAAEIELVRAIGLAIGEPEKYAARWRRVRDD